MNIEGEYVYFTGTEGNQHLLPKVRMHDQCNNAGWRGVSFSATFSEGMNYRRRLTGLTPAQDETVRKLCNQQPTYEHYL